MAIESLADRSRRAGVPFGSVARMAVIVARRNGDRWGELTDEEQLGIIGDVLTGLEDWQGLGFRLTRIGVFGASAARIARSLRGVGDRGGDDGGR